MKNTITMIAACGTNNELGYKNNLPWKRMDHDMQRFHSCVQGMVIVMGKNSYDHLPIDLHWKECIVLAEKQYATKFKRTAVLCSLDEVFAYIQEKYGEGEEVIICGGASIYRQFLPIANKILLTRIDGAFEADAYFPGLISEEWDEIERVEYKKDEKNPYDYTFLLLQRKKDTVRHRES